MAREQFQNLTEPMYYILLSLTEERHGYGIMQQIKEETSGRVLVGPGTLYALLGRFEKEAMIKQVSNEARRKTYILTDHGRDLLMEEYNRLKMLIEDGNKVLFTLADIVDDSLADTLIDLPLQEVEESPAKPVFKKKRRGIDDLL